MNDEPGGVYRTKCISDSLLYQHFHVHVEIQYNQKVD
jgi:hypothetical protein